MDSAMRKAVGHDIVGMARLIEAASLGLRDHRTTFHRTMTKRENQIVAAAEQGLVKSAGLLRRIGNRMVTK